ncbi:helix-turn-helix domain-containing protein [Streptomyces sp. CA-243310]|uniref:helix-turn-helix domain-containing protein n=1 Tax=Streptomyces sp. CA-243310 TaxID=3240056 RepID=UPI003D90524E
MIDTDPYNPGLGRPEEDAHKALLVAGAGDAVHLDALTGVGKPGPDSTPARPAGRGVTTPLPGESPEPDTSPTPSPATTLRLLVRRRQALLRQESAELERLCTYADGLAERPHAALGAGRSGGPETLSGAEDITTRVRHMLAAAQREVLILDRPPGTGGLPDPAPDGEALGPAIGDLLDRGVIVRTIVDREWMKHPGRPQTLGALTERGLQARVGVRLPTRLIVVDRHSCLLPPSVAGGGAEPALVPGGAMLRRAVLPLFETLWDSATPVGNPDSHLTTPQRELLSLLASGLKDEAIARRLGVHVHTARRRISGMLDDLDAGTRFQAGAQAVMRGWLDRAVEV